MGSGGGRKVRRVYGEWRRGKGEEGIWGVEEGEREGEWKSGEEWVKEREESETMLDCMLMFLFGILFWLISNTASATLCRRALKSPPEEQRRRSNVEKDRAAM